METETASRPAEIVFQHLHDQTKISTFCADDPSAWHPVTEADVKFLLTIQAMAASFVSASVVEGAKTGLTLPITIEIVKSALVQQILALKG